VGDRVVVELVKLLLLVCRPTLRRLAIRAHRAAPALSTVTREAITGFCRPQTSVTFELAANSCDCKASNNKRYDILHNFLIK
jgi:hypothetical protein